MLLRSTMLLLFIGVATCANTQVMNSRPVVNKEILFASDTQAPMWVETLWLKQNNNRTATKSIFDNIISRNPESVYLLGDVVSLGYSNRQWKPIDGYLQRLRSEGVKVCAALGNHEVLGKSGKGQKKFQQRFPEHNKTGFVDVSDSVAVILLNSNFRSLSAAEDAAQIEWYKQKLQQLDADPSIQFIITGCHHSPYSNSKIVGSSMSVRQKFVPLFLSSQKSRLFLSGHSHNFEHFHQQGKDFFVIGGGGGLHQPLKSGANTLTDLSASYKPLFHYLSIQRTSDQLNVSSIWLNPDFTGFKEGAKFTINKAAANPLNIATISKVLPVIL